MYKLKLFSILLLGLVIGTTVSAQYESCSQCNMAVEDALFRAKALTTSEKQFQFDAVECLVNHLKNNQDVEYNGLWVTDYKSGQLINATEAYYLKSKSIPSPMGANLSAYSSKATALSMQTEKGGEVFSWKELKIRFEHSKFGAAGHSHEHHSRPDSYAPAGIMGDHLHPKGGFMFSFRSMSMAMGGNREGSGSISNEAIYDRFMIAPQDMTMQMYMLGVMYAPSDKLTLMAMQNFVDKSMDLRARMMMNDGMVMFNNFSTSSQGFSDLKLGLLYSLYQGEKSSIHLNTGLNVPLGEIKNRDNTPAMENAKLPYAMQLGSGTWDLVLGGTFKRTYNTFSWGLQQLNTIRTGTNSEGYRFGNVHELNAWAGYLLSKKISASLRVSGCTESDITGSDEDLNPMMVPTADPENYGGELIRGALGFNVVLAQNKLVLGGELVAPLYQNYNGIFMDEDISLNAALRYTLF